MENKAKKVITDKTELIDFILLSIHNSKLSWVSDDFFDITFGKGITWDYKTMDAVRPIIKYYTEDSFHQSKKRGIQLNEKGLELIHVYGSYRNLIKAQKNKTALSVINKYAIPVTIFLTILSTWQKCESDKKDDTIIKMQERIHSIEDSLSNSAKLKSLK